MIRVCYILLGMIYPGTGGRINIKTTSIFSDKTTVLSMLTFTCRSCWIRLRLRLRFHYDGILSDNWSHTHDLVSAKGKTKEVYYCDIVVLIVLFWCFWCVKDYNVVSVYWNVVWWGSEMTSISWLLFSPLPKLGQLSGCDVSWPRRVYLSD